MASPALTRESVEQFVLAELVRLGAEESEIGSGVALEDLGLDSLDMTELGTAVKRQLGVEVRPRDFEDVVVVQDALDVIHGRAGL
ncbi:acyl carrier protein [Streptomyces sp. OM5714]|uniref:acyl carrier protein n=1 Tax=Streptomyces TaxID=1883 RepID=UPI0013DA245E|nr:acyl carrier protein [Streptomyces sp. OM5714]KAF2776481.1 acyl carrier protein [Streptomyces sp. OM5714]